MAKLDHYAILVTITDYPGLSNLKGPEADGEALTQWLTSADGGDLPPGNIQHIRSSDFQPIADVYEANPTEIQLKKALDKLLRESEDRSWKDRAGERLYLFFAGHGFTAGSSLTDPALFSAVAQNGDTAHIAGYRYASKIAIAGFFDEILLFMDCCQDVLKSSQVLEPTWAPPDRNRASRVKVLQAYGAPRGKKAYERDLDDNGVTRGLFTVVLLEALRTAIPDDQGWVNGYELKKQFAQIWGKRFRDETHYDPPIRIPDGEDIRILRRLPPPPPTRGGEPPTTPRSSTVEVDITELVLAAGPQVRVSRAAPSTDSSESFTVDLDTTRLENLPTGMFTIETEEGQNDLTFEVLPSEGTFQVGHIEIQEIPAQPAAVEPHKRYEVEITAADSAMQVKIFDADYNPVASGYGSLQVELHPGMYKTEVTAGGARSQEIFRVSDQALSLDLETPYFPTAAPVAGSSTSHEYQSWPAHDLALGAPLHTFADADSELMVFIRASEPEHGSALAWPSPWEGLHIRDFPADGDASMVPLEAVEEGSFYGASKLALPAGPYALCSEQYRDGHAQTFAFPLQTVPGWRTELYIDSIMEAAGEDNMAPPLARPDFAGASVHLVKIGEPALVHEELGTRTELARIRLASGRRPVIPEDKDVARSPMLGLYSAFAVYQRNPQDKATIERCLRAVDPVVSRLTDLRLLATWLNDRPVQDSLQPLDIPMLNIAWELSRELQPERQLAPALRGLLGQWRTGGSLWTNWQRPLAVTEVDTTGVAALVTPGQSCYAVLATSERRPGADALSTPLDPPWSLDVWRSRADKLRSPHPGSSPFQQALRRRLLDAIELDDELEDAEVFSLGAQFELEARWSAQEYTAFFHMTDSGMRLAGA